jgi:hypothetical protein
MLSHCPQTLHAAFDDVPHLVSGPKPSITVPPPPYPTPRRLILVIVRRMMILQSILINRNEQVFSLTFGQFLIEYYEQPHDHNPLTTTHHRKYVAHSRFFFHPPPEQTEPLPIRSTYNVTLPTSQSPPASRMTMLRKATIRGKVKPTGLFIHPKNSNLTRADAAAVELGLHRSTERVEALRTSCDSDDDDVMAAWGQGRGRDTARNLLAGATHRQTRSHSRSESQQKLFQVVDSESDD